MWTYNYTDELYHFGVKGMKWGVRKAGKYTTRHVRGHGGPGKYFTKKRQLDGDKRDLEKLNRGEHLSIGLTKKRQAKYDARDRRLLEKRIAKNEADKKEKPQPHEDYTKAHDKRSVKELSDKELRARINRLNMEREYSEAKRKANKGKQAVQSYIKTAGTIAAIAGATKTYQKYLSPIVESYGDKILRNVASAVSD